MGAADGSAALRYAGRVLASGPASSTVVVRSGLDVPLGPESKLGYAVRPDDAASTHVALDVVYTDRDGRHPRTHKARASDTTIAPGSGTPSRPTSAPSPESESVRSGCATRTRMPSRVRGPQGGSTTYASARPSSTTRRPGATWTLRVSTRRGGHGPHRMDPGRLRRGDVPWKKAAGPFGVKNDGSDLGADFPVRTKLKLRKDTGDSVEAYFFRSSFSMDRASSTRSPGCWARSSTTTP
ncbi:hypothetical protein NKH18_18650 [Streptomyces sp. M10(2022)]